MVGLVGAMVGLPIAALASEGEAAEKPEVSFVEPIITEETLPNDLHELSLRLTTDYREQDQGERVGALPRLDVFYGLIERVGVELSIPFAYHRDAEREDYGIGDVSVALKYLVLEHGAKWPAVVVGVESGFPTGSTSRGLGEGAYELTPFVALLKDFGPCSLQGNIGWSKQVSGEHNERVVYNWAFAVPLCERKVYLLAELNGAAGSSPEVAVAPGIKYNFTHEMFVGVAVPIGLNTHTPDWGIVTQFQVGF
jgi:hypothetical protein